jgi:hypothetical protein
MVKATLHLINKYSYISIVYCCLVSCAIIKDSPQFLKTNGYKSERIESVKAHYGRVLQKFLNQKNMRRVPALHLSYLNSLIKTSKVFIKEVIVVKDPNSFYFISPSRKIVVSDNFAKLYFQNEQLLSAFLVENYVRVSKNIFSRKVYYPNSLINYEDLAKIMALSLNQKQKLNYLSVEKIIQFGGSPISYLNYIQQRNKDGRLVNNLLNGRVYGLEEERRLKAYLIENHKKVFIEKVELDTSSKKFYGFKKFLSKAFKIYE